MFWLALGGALLTASAINAQTTISDSILHGGMYRTYRLYVPAIYNPSVSVPLVLNLHGYTSNNQQQEFYGDFRPIADTANFIIVHPNGTLDGSNNLYWNAFGWSTVDDVGFLSALMDTIDSQYNIDANSIYSTGMSNGGYMSYDLACYLSNRIAAIASVTGTMIPSHFNSCNPGHPMPVMEIHGTADGTVPYNGSSSMVPIDTLVSFWAQFNNCLMTPSVSTLPNTNTTDGCTAEHHVYSGGTYGSSVELYKIIGGGHSWPGASFNINVTNMDFKASVEIWRFFRQYKLNILTETSPVDNPPSSVSVFPNPSSGIFYLNTKKMNVDKGTEKIKAYNLLGEIINISVDENSASGKEDIRIIDLSAHPNGMYFLLIPGNHGMRFEKIIKN